MEPQESESDVTDGNVYEGGQTQGVESDSHGEVGSQTSAMRIGENALVALEQKPGMTVVVSLVALGETGWVVIHDSDDGLPGRILGARRLQAGEHSLVTVELLRGTEEGHSYIAMLHSDDGDGEFNNKTDLPIMGFDDSPIMMEFSASNTAQDLPAEISI